jgi:hypothetical protein
VTTDPLCLDCKHLDRSDPKGPTRCAAFPVGIPVEILLSRRDHRGPHPGDRGIRFEPADDDPGPPSR